MKQESYSDQELWSQAMHTDLRRRIEYIGQKDMSFFGVLLTAEIVAMAFLGFAVPLCIAWSML